MNGQSKIWSESKCQTLAVVHKWLQKLLLPKCAVGVRKEEWGADGEMKGAEDGLTAPEGNK